MEKIIKFYYGNSDIIVDVPENKLIIGQENFEAVIWCDKIKVICLGEISIMVQFLVKNKIIGSIEYFINNTKNGRKFECVEIEIEKYHLRLDDIYK